jgi:hypothetical protein
MKNSIYAFVLDPWNILKTFESAPLPGYNMIIPRKEHIVNKFALIALAFFTFLVVGCPTPGTPSAKIAYIYDSVDSRPFTTASTVLSGYDVTMIDHSTVTVTPGMLAGYDLIIVADQENPWEYNSALANPIILAWKPVIAMGYAGPYFYAAQDNVSTQGLYSVGSGASFTLGKTDATNSIWSTPHTIANAAAVTTTFTGWATAAGTTFSGVTLANWPASYSTSTHALSIGSYVSGTAFHIIARESDKYILWGIYGSIDDLSQTGKDLFANAVYSLLN